MQLPCTWLYPSATYQILFSYCKGNANKRNRQTFWCLFPIKSVSAMSKNALASEERKLAFWLFRALSSSRRSLRERFSEWRVELVRTLPSAEFFEAKPQRTRLSFFVTRRGVEPLLALRFQIAQGVCPRVSRDYGIFTSMPLATLHESTFTVTNLIIAPSRIGSRFSSVEA